MVNFAPGFNLSTYREEKLTLPASPKNDASPWDHSEELGTDYRRAREEEKDEAMLERMHSSGLSTNIIREIDAVRAGISYECEQWLEAEYPGLDDKTRQEYLIFFNGLSKKNQKALSKMGLKRKQLVG